MGTWALLVKGAGLEPDHQKLGCLALYGDGAVWHRKSSRNVPGSAYYTRRDSIRSLYTVDAENRPVSSQSVGSLIDAQCAVHSKSSSRYDVFLQAWRLVSVMRDNGWVLLISQGACIQQADKQQRDGCNTDRPHCLMCRTSMMAIRDILYKQETLFQDIPSAVAERTRQVKQNKTKQNNSIDSDAVGQASTS